VAFAISAAVVAVRWSPGQTVKEAAEAGNGSLEKTVTQGGRVVRGLGRIGAQVAEAFLAENIQRTFSDYTTSIAAEEKGRVFAAKIEAIEETSITSSKFWGNTTVTVRVPAIFQYSLSLKEPWRIRTESTETSTICYVVCPDLRPVLPVAFDTRGMEVKVKTGWMRFDGDERQLEAIREITPHLMKRSGERASQARDKARRFAAEFVRGWLLDRDQWGTGKIQRVIVSFPDEVDRQGNPLPVEKRRSD
jgi:hypothetical protein